MVESGDEFLKGGENVTPRAKKDKRLVGLDKAGPSPYLTLSFQAKPYLHTSTLQTDTSISISFPSPSLLAPMAFLLQSLPIDGKSMGETSKMEQG